MSQPLSLERGEPLYLVSGAMPACGSSTIARGIANRILAGDSPGVVFASSGVRGLSSPADILGIDSEVYRSLPDDKPCVVDCKQAPHIGLESVPEGRPVITVNLTSPPPIRAKRSLQQEGAGVLELFTDEGREALLGKLIVDEAVSVNSENRVASHPHVIEGAGKVGVESFLIDSSRLSVPQIIDHVTGSGSHEVVASWEIAILDATTDLLMEASTELSDDTKKRDLIHFQDNIERLKSNVDRLSANFADIGIDRVREEVKDAIVGCWLSLVIKKIPRFFVNSAGGNVLDNQSSNWTPGYHRIAEAWTSVVPLLKGKKVLDPFAGPGTLVHALAAKGVPDSVTLSDISYSGGVPMDGELLYDPRLNREVWRCLFDDLPSWYKPNFSSVQDYVLADARKLPFEDDAFDYVFTDPPYGKNLGSGGVQILLDSMKEITRVTTEGSVLLIPVGWVNDLERYGYDVKILSKDVSGESSSYPTCYAVVK